jgi:hypothetical protein
MVVKSSNSDGGDKRLKDNGIQEMLLVNGGLDVILLKSFEETKLIQSVLWTNFH